MIDGGGGGAVSPNLHGQVVDRSSSNGGGSSMCGPTTADRDILVYQQLTNLINAGYSEVSGLWESPFTGQVESNYLIFINNSICVAERGSTRIRSTRQRNVFSCFLPRGGYIYFVWLSAPVCRRCLIRELMALLWGNGLLDDARVFGS